MKWYSAKELSSITGKSVSLVYKILNAGGGVSRFNYMLKGDTFYFGADALEHIKAS